jgi:hypothetical protein
MGGNRTPSCDDFTSYTYILDNLNSQYQLETYSMYLSGVNPWSLYLYLLYLQSAIDCVIGCMNYIDVFVISL